MKSLSILGSTGSIGCNVLEVVSMHPELFSVKALCCGRNVELLSRQIEAFRPEMAVVIDSDHALELEKKLPSGFSDIKILHGAGGYCKAASIPAVDMVVSAMVGSAGLLPTLSGVDAGKAIALANKETLVMAGDIVMGRAREAGVDILPVDSEHSAIFQCLAGQRGEDFSRILLTASGGPFRETPVELFGRITLEDALDHPNWDMGKKISIDSATMMNKGLEIIEAMHLFQVSADDIEVVVHPQSIVHSMVSYVDGGVMAQMGIPDMKGAIAYALSYPARLDIGQPPPNFPMLGNLSFEAPDPEKFPCLSLAFEAARVGHTLPAVLNAANEMAVDAFLNEQIQFVQIPEIIKNTMDSHTVVENPGLDDIIEADSWARMTAEKKGRLLSQANFKTGTND